MTTAPDAKPTGLSTLAVKAPIGFLRSRILGARAVSPRRKNIALAIAGAADLLQIVLWPLFSEGVTSPFEDVLDVVVGIALLATLGFSGRLALAFALELIPGADLFPTWTAVVASIPSAVAPPAELPEKLEVDPLIERG